jgi:hypothetical protein
VVELNLRSFTRLRALGSRGLVLASLLTGALAAGALAAAGTAQPAPGEAASGADAVQMQAFAIMRRGSLPADSDGPRHPASFSAASGANPLLARRAAGLQGASGWVVPGTGTVCVEVEDTAGSNGGAACSSETAAAEGHLVLSARSAALPGLVLVAGLVPDGVSEVTVELADGSGVSVPVQENIYAREVQGPVAAVSFRGPGGPVSLRGEPES